MKKSWRFPSCKDMTMCFLQSVELKELVSAGSTPACKSFHSWRNLEAYGASPKDGVAPKATVPCCGISSGLTYWPSSCVLRSPFRMPASYHPTELNDDDSENPVTSLTGNRLEWEAESHCRMRQEQKHFSTTRRFESGLDTNLNNRSN